MTSSCYEVKSNSEYGRYCVTIRDVKAGEVILVDTPAIVGPKPDSYITCLSCYIPLDDESSDNNRCPICKWPLCAKCAAITSSDHKNECEIFSKNKVTFQNVDDPKAICLQLDCITPLRLLLAKEADPERWNTEIECMEHHEAVRRDSKYWQADSVNIVNYLRGPCKLSRFSEDLIQQIIGLLEVNCFEARTKAGTSVRCLYPQLGVFAHSCIPNTAHSIFPSDNYRSFLRATIDIPKGQIINVCYTYTLQGTLQRQAFLKESKYFICHCNRCEDPTEMGTHFSSFKCSKCDPGLIITTDPYNDEAQWQCTHCEFKTTGHAIQRAINVMQSEIAACENIELDAKKLEFLEQIYRKYRSILHPNHFINTSLRQNLIQLYGRAESYELNDLPDVLLERKVDICRTILKVLDVVEPGLTRSRAYTLYEMHAPLVLLARTAYAAGVLSGEPLKLKLHEAISILEECHKIFSWEDKNTTEAYLSIMSQEAAEQLRESIKVIQA